MIDAQSDRAIRNKRANKLWPLIDRQISAARSIWSFAHAAAANPVVDDAIATHGMLKRNYLSVDDIDIARLAETGPRDVGQDDEA